MVQTACRHRSRISIQGKSSAGGWTKPAGRRATWGPCHDLRKLPRRQASRVTAGHAFILPSNLHTILLLPHLTLLAEGRILDSAVERRKSFAGSGKLAPGPFDVALRRDTPIASVEAAWIITEKEYLGVL